MATQVESVRREVPFNDPEYRERMTLRRKRRSLLTRAYHAAKTQARQELRKKGRYSKDASQFYLKAADIVETGRREGITVGGIERHDRLSQGILHQMAQERSNVERLGSAFTPRKNTLFSDRETETPQYVSPPRSDEEEEDALQQAALAPTVPVGIEVPQVNPY
jgi:hypothetical protein